MIAEGLVQPSIKLQSLILGNEFSWYYNDYIINDGREDSNYQFTHLFFWTESKSAHSIKLMPLVNKLGIKEGQLFKLKANLNVKTPNHEYGGYHTDGYKNKITSIFYINTNNGDLLFEYKIVNNSLYMTFLKFQFEMSKVSLHY